MVEGGLEVATGARLDGADGRIVLEGVIVTFCWFLDWLGGRCGWEDGVLVLVGLVASVLQMMRSCERAGVGKRVTSSDEESFCCVHRQAMCKRYYTLQLYRVWSSSNTDF